MAAQAGLLHTPMRLLGTRSAGENRKKKRNENKLPRAKIGHPYTPTPIKGNTASCRGWDLR